MDFELRPATESDRDWLFALHQATMRESIAAIWGWDEEFRPPDMPG